MRIFGSYPEPELGQTDKQTQKFFIDLELGNIRFATIVKQRCILENQHFHGTFGFYVFCCAFMELRTRKEKLPSSATFFFV